jgi:hypothetical protein
MAFAEITAGDQVIRYDRDRTQRVYAGVEKGDADVCGCLYCQNFAAQRASAFPETFKRLLDQLGIDPSKEGEVYELGSTERGTFSYGGWFYFCGEMLEAGERNTTSGAFEYWFTAKIPNAHAFHGESVIAVEFLTTLNWILAVRPE